MTNTKDSLREEAHELWDANDVARYMKVSRSWVYQRAEAGLLPCLRLGGLLRFDPTRSAHSRAVSFRRPRCCLSPVLRRERTVDCVGGRAMLTLVEALGGHDRDAAAGGT